MICTPAPVSLQQVCKVRLDLRSRCTANQGHREACLPLWKTERIEGSTSSLSAMQGRRKTTDAGGTAVGALAAAAAATKHSNVKVSLLTVNSRLTVIRPSAAFCDASGPPTAQRCMAICWCPEHVDGWVMGMPRWTVQRTSSRLTCRCWASASARAMHQGSDAELSISCRRISQCRTSTASRSVKGAGKVRPLFWCACRCSSLVAGPGGRIFKHHCMRFPTSVASGGLLQVHLMHARCGLAA